MSSWGIGASDEVSRDGEAETLPTLLVTGLTKCIGYILTDSSVRIGSSLWSESHGPEDN